MVLMVLESKRWIASEAMRAEQPSDAKMVLDEAIDLAGQLQSPSLVSDFALLASQTALQVDNTTSAAGYWNAAVKAQVSAMTISTPDFTEGQTIALPYLDCHFWQQATDLRPIHQTWPQEVSLAALPWAQQLGLGIDSQLLPETVLNSAMARKQMVSGQPELAIVFLKKAELTASDDAKPWLRIAQARCLMAQDQAVVAATLLAEPASHANPKIQAAALTTLGSAKLHSGAFAQGAQIIKKALDDAGDSDFPGRLDAEADLANAQLILGELESALDALHFVQQKYQIAGRWQSLVQSLENEASILELDSRHNDAIQVRQRIQQLERL